MLFRSALVAQSLLDNETIDGAMVSRLIQQGLGEPSKQPNDSKPNV